MSISNYVIESKETISGTALNSTVEVMSSTTTHCDSIRIEASDSFSTVYTF